MPADTSIEKADIRVVERADALAQYIWTGIFGLSSIKPYRCDYDGINLGFSKIAIASWPLIITRIVLPLVILFPLGAPPDWTVPLRGTNLGGTTIGLVFFVLYFASMAIQGFGTVGPRFVRSMSLRLYNTGHQLIGLMLPIAVVLIWAGV